jgi:ankyrin repeat protein
VSERRRATGDGDDAALRELFEAITSSDDRDIARLLELSRELVARALQVGADRRRPDLFLDRIHHYAYAGDTALHIAAAAHRPATAELLLAEGADVSARNRRGAQPLH